MPVGKQALHSNNTYERNDNVLNALGIVFEKLFVPKFSDLHTERQREPSILRHFVELNVGIAMAPYILDVGG